MNFKKTLLATAVTAAMGVSAYSNAAVFEATFTGAFTMLNGGGGITYNTDVAHCYTGMLTSPSQCSRTAVSGTISYDTDAHIGSMGIIPFSFFGSGLASGTSLTFQAIGNGDGNPTSGNLLLGNLEFNWNSNYGIPVSIVWDGTGLFNAITAGLQPGDTITGTGANGVLPASDNTGGTSPLGKAVMATTVFNTTAIGTPVLGTNPSGTLPLVTDTVTDTTNGDLGIGGSPMVTAPFKGYNANFDIMAITVVPLPSAAWLFGSGLVGLVGMARRKRRV